MPKNSLPAARKTSAGKKTRSKKSTDKLKPKKGTSKPRQIKREGFAQLWFRIFEYAPWCIWTKRKISFSFPNRTIIVLFNDGHRGYTTIDYILDGKPFTTEICLGTIKEVFLLQLSESVLLICFRDGRYIATILSRGGYFVSSPMTAKQKEALKTQLRIKASIPTVPR